MSLSKIIYRAEPRFVTDIRLTNKLYDGRRRPSGPTRLDKEFYLEPWNYTDPVAIMRFGYLTTSIGHESGVFRPFWSYNHG